MKAHSFLDMLRIAAAGLRAENVNNISKLLPLRPSKDALQYKFFSGDVCWEILSHEALCKKVACRLSNRIVFVQMCC